MAEHAVLTYAGKPYELPVVIGTENEPSVDISDLRAKSGLITLDDGYGNTGSCQSAITFIDGEKGILRYRGYPIEELVEKSNFVEVAYLLIFGALPTRPQLDEFLTLVTEHQCIHENLKHHFDGFPANAPPMAVLSAMINAVSCFEPELNLPHEESKFTAQAARLISQVRMLASASYKKMMGQYLIYPRYDLDYSSNFLHMMFSVPNKRYEPDPAVARALDQIFILHADHEQNCSTSTVRMVGSSQAGLHASISAGVCALWGPLHGGANQAVIEMLTEMREEGISVSQFIGRVKDKDSRARLMGFGHRVYKNYDPRARFIKRSCDEVLAKMGIKDPLLDLAKQLEEAALSDPYFVERKLYPNVDFYSGIIMRAIGIPVNMFPVLFAIGRMPGWIANWREVHQQPKPKIYRPRQVYVGATQRAYQSIDQRR